MFNPHIHHRRSIRLRGYDYSQAGLYFVTIVTQDRTDLFGNISDGKMALNDAGKMVQRWYSELVQKFPNIQCDEIIIMPNHIHFIVQIINTVGADLRVCPSPSPSTRPVQPNLTQGVCPNLTQGEHIGSPLHAVVQWLKTMTTNEYIRRVKSGDWQPFNKRIWQRNYYEHIIRNENEYDRIAQYIRNNPAKWEQDRFNNNGAVK